MTCLITDRIKQIKAVREMMQLQYGITTGLSETKVFVDHMQRCLDEQAVYEVKQLLGSFIQHDPLFPVGIDLNRERRVEQLRNIVKKAFAQVAGEVL